MSLAAGTKLGPYEIVAPLGAGGMGEVYRSRDAKLGRDVAIKVLPEALAADPTALERLEREAKTLASTSHPNILSIFDFGTSGRVTYIVMELLDGHTLRTLLTAGPLPARKAVDYAIQVAEGLGAAHERGIVHRDLKPENLFVTGDGRVKILDFGLARQQILFGADDATALAQQHTEPGTVLGTVGYMSPEQVRGKPADARSDIFSFGAVLYEMLGGGRAFKGDSAAETLHAILHDDPPDLLAAVNTLPPALDRIVAHCLEKSPEQRFQSARDVAFDLESVATLSGSARSGAVPPVRTANYGRIATYGALVGAGALAGALVAGAIGKAPPIEFPSYRRLTFDRGNVPRRASHETAKRSSTAPPGVACRTRPSRRGSTAASRARSGWAMPCCRRCHRPASWRWRWTPIRRSQAPRSAGSRSPAARRAQASSMSPSPIGCPPATIWRSCVWQAANSASNSPWATSCTGRATTSLI